MLSSMFMVSDMDLFTAVLTLEDNTVNGMQAIAEVIWNRSKGDKANLRKTLLKKWQFSCLNSHTIHDKPLEQLVKDAKMRSNWTTAKTIVSTTLKGKQANITEGATHYHVYKGINKVTPFWTHPTLGGKNKKSKITCYIGYHVFLNNVD